MHPVTAQLAAALADPAGLGRLVAAPVQLTPARSQMAFTLAVHILLVPLGVALPTLMLIANYKGLRHDDRAALLLARRWSHATGLTFAVGAVTGTVLSFEMGLLWPGFTKVFGDVFGLPFAIEGIAFFVEALLVAIYIYGWRRLNPWTHFWLGFPIPFVALIGAVSIIAANSWMNSPAGFVLGANGKPTNVDPFAAMFNKALPLEFTHFVLAAYMCACFAVASIYVVGWMRGRRDRYHRLGFLIPFTIAAVATPLQFVAGDTIARWVYRNQPAKFSAIEEITNSATHQAEYIYGRYDPVTNTVKGGLKIPGFDSFLAGGKTSTYVPGLAAVAPDDRASNVTLAHWAFDTMVLIATLLLALVAWFVLAYWRRRDVPRLRIFLWVAAAAGVLAYAAMECGWITTEVGRQPWIVYQVARTSEAVTTSHGIDVSFGVVIAVYACLAIATIMVLRVMSRRWRRGDAIDDSAAPYGPRVAVAADGDADRAAGADRAGAAPGPGRHRRAAP